MYGKGKGKDGRKESGHPPEPTDTCGRCPGRHLRITLVAPCVKYQPWSACGDIMLTKRTRAHNASDHTPSDTSKGAHAGRVGRRTYGKENAVHVSTGHVTTYRKSPDGGSKCPVWRPARRLSKVGGRAVQGKNLDGKELGRKNEREGKERDVGTPPNPRTHAVAALADTCA